MAKSSSLDKAKIAALLLFIALSIVLVGWTVLDAYSESSRGTSSSQEYQASVVDTPSPTSTEWAQQDRSTPQHSGDHQQGRTPTPRATDPFNTD